VITTVAPAKINLSLEVLGRREDGYHEVRTVMQAIELHDEISFEAGKGSSLRIEGSPVAPDEDLIRAAADAFRARVPATGVLRVKKALPVGAGLGGGSSDAAATLRLLNQASGSDMDGADLATLASEIGSDVPFFLRGGAALAEGRGEQITPLPDAPTNWFVLVVPPISIADKTRRMYASLESQDFSDGSRTNALADLLAGGSSLDPALLGNAFERAADAQFLGLAKYRERMITAGASSVHLSGAGPALFAVASGEEEARAIRARMVRPKAGERVCAVRTITAAESTLTWDS
jgi:4-diphosphocytidyl-2-C-methyl-D-erythritol kinase